MFSSTQSPATHLFSHSPPGAPEPAPSQANPPAEWPWFLADEPGGVVVLLLCALVWVVAALQACELECDELRAAVGLSVPIPAGRQ